VGVAVTKPTAVHQLLVALHPGDAVGNEALAIQAHLKALGFSSEVFAAWTDPRLRGRALGLAECVAAATAETVLLFHFGCGSPAGRLALATPARLVVVYHNITPAHFFAPFSAALTRECHEGRLELRELAPRAELALAKSEFSRNELVDLGFRRTEVLPYVIDAARYHRPTSPVVRRLHGRDRTNVLVVGRVAPNKKIEDALRAFAVYQRRFNRRSRLLVVGESRGQERYLHALLRLAGELGVRDVAFLGHVEDDDLLGYYAVANVLVSLSEHEGYGVPLVEAMILGVPVVAFEAGAVGETLAGAGLTLREKDPVQVAAAIDAVVADALVRQAVLASQASVAARLLATDFAGLLKDRLTPVIGEGEGP
jgi:L-malate glycosyltransferase